ncbi:hypothetical protein [Pseudomonas sp. MWU13-2100]|uniref:hypothetical protein n=1 Tax=Pseudomonas sp. MWU13-2100 TaxID=2935075 RepID=UPI00200C191D|nr:hypothetical protein [Pseudomonas sp. MWU13-2100]
MLNGKERQASLPEFLVEAQALQTKMQECCQHLELIRNDKDAIDCLVISLHTLANCAQGLGVRCMARFSRQIHALLSQPQDPLNLHEDALLALRNCLTLLAWQVELIDPQTGQLGLDDDEESELITALAIQTGQYGSAATEPRTFTLITFPERSA